MSIVVASAESVSPELDWIPSVCSHATTLEVQCMHVARITFSHTPPDALVAVAQRMDPFGVGPANHRYAHSIRLIVCCARPLSLHTAVDLEGCSIAMSGDDSPPAMVVGEVEASRQPASVARHRAVGFHTPA